MAMIIPYFSLSKSDEKKSADFMVFGDIISKESALMEEAFGSPADVSSYDFVEQLKEIPEDYEITVHINSNGGEVKEGLAIYNALKMRNATTICEGFAASAASLVFMGGKRRIMNRASLLFIHQAITCASGNPDELDKVAEDLRTITNAAANAYREGGVNLGDEALNAMLKAETWITPEAALRDGFATEIAEAGSLDAGAITNSAMPAIYEAIIKGQNSYDERLENLLDALEKIVPKLNPINQSTTVESIKEEPKKGFFNF